MGEVRASVGGPRGQLEKSICALTSKYKELLDELDDVILDQERIRDGWEVYVAVDFHEVFDYAYPYHDFLRKFARGTGAPSEKEQRELVQNQVALSFLFRGFKAVAQPILLPPHVVELRNHLRGTQIRSLSADLSVEAVRNWRGSLLTKHENEVISAAAKQYSQGIGTANLPKTLRRELIGIIFSKFYELILLVTGVAEFGVDRITQLLESEQLQIVSQLTNDYADLIADVINKPNSRIYDLLTAIRSSPIASNHFDAKAIDIVLALSKAFATSDSPKTMIYLLTNAGAIRTMFSRLRHREGAGVSDIGDPQLNQFIMDAGEAIHRSANVYLLYMMAATDHVPRESPVFWESRQATVEALKKRKGFVLTFNTFGSSFNEFLVKCNNACIECDLSLKQECETFKRELKDWEKLYDERESLSMLSKRLQWLQEEPNSIDIEVEAGLRSVVWFLSGDNPDFEAQLRQKRESMDVRYLACIDSLRKRMVDMAAAELDEDGVYQLEMFRRIPFRVEFDNEQIAAAVEDIQSYLTDRSSWSPKTTLLLTRRVLELTQKEDIGPERYLLMAIVNYNLNQLEMVRPIVADCLVISDLPRREIYTLIDLLALLRLGVEGKNYAHYFQAMVESGRALGEYEDDPRFHFVYGRVIVHGVTAGFGGEMTLENALVHFDKALELATAAGCADKVLVASVLDSIAFCVAMRESLDGLDRAIDALSRIETLVEEPLWNATFQNTYGFVYYRLALLEDDARRKRELLADARDHLDKAVRLGRQSRYLRFELQSYQRNLGQVEDALVSLMDGGGISES
jgi:hypothetical protein